MGPVLLCLLDLTQHPTSDQKFVYPIHRPTLFPRRACSAEFLASPQKSAYARAGGRVTRGRQTPLESESRRGLKQCDASHPHCTQTIARGDPTWPETGVPYSYVQALVPRAEAAARVCVLCTATLRTGVGQKGTNIQARDVFTVGQQESLAPRVKHSCSSRPRGKPAGPPRAVWRLLGCRPSATSRHARLSPLGVQTHDLYTDVLDASGGRPARQ